MEKNDLFLDNYLRKITEDFKGFAERSSKSVSKEWYSDPTPRINEFANELELKFGSKYIKILSGGSAHSFIVNTDKDEKFKKGDILMAASWSTPARNKPRGNIFDNDYKVRWTGAI
jgi:hypothetical protein